jgi:hypothetical protein
VCVFVCVCMCVSVCVCAGGEKNRVGIKCEWRQKGVVGGRQGEMPRNTVQYSAVPFNTA